MFNQPADIRLDQAVVAWFKAQGPDYEARINDVLHAFVQARREAESNSDGTGVPAPVAG